jgi:hypothetical protein
LRRGPSGGRRAIVVIGMHRSGTSAVARLLMLLGAAGPRNVYPADADNKAGYWEPTPIVELNNRLLSLVSSGWDDVGALPERWWQAPEAVRLVERGVEQLGSEYGDALLFALKDPRISRTLPFWRTVLGEAGIDPTFVLVVRNPIEVAASLKVRDGIVSGRALLLWLRYMLEAEFETRGMPRAVVSYAQLLRDWRSVADDLASRLDLSWSGLTPMASVEIERFISSQHRNHSFTLEELSGSPAVSEWVKATYAAFEEATAAGVEPPGAELDRVRAELAGADLLFGQVVAEAELELNARTDELAQTADLLAERGDELAAARNRIAVLERKLAAARKRQDQHRERLHTLDSQLRERSAEASNREAEASRLSGQLEAVRAELDDTREQHDSQLANLRREINSSREAELRAHAERAEQQLAEVRTANSANLQRERELRDALRAQAQERAELESELTQLEGVVAWVQHLERSRSWRFTSPLRGIATMIRRLFRRTVDQPPPPPVSLASGGDSADDAGDRE